MGEGVYKSCVDSQVEVYKSLSGIDTIDSIYFGFLNGKFTKLDETNYKDLLDSGTSSCKCGCGK